MFKNSNVSYDSPKKNKQVRGNGVSIHHFTMMREEKHHFEAKMCINNEQDKVSDFGNVQHGIEVVGTLEQGQPPLLA